MTFQLIDETPVDPVVADTDPPMLEDSSASRPAVNQVAFGLTAVDLAALGLAAALVTCLLPVGFNLWWPRLAVLIAVMPLGLLYLMRSAGRRDWPSILVLGFLVAAATSAALSAAPAVSLVGTIRSNASFLIYLGVASAWAIGTRVTSRGQHALGWAVLGASLFSGLFAIIELLAGVETGPLQLFHDRPPGLAMHPVFFGAFNAGSAAWFSHRLSRRVNALDLAGLTVFAGFASLSGSRIALATVVGFGILALVRSRDVRAWWMFPAIGLGAICGTAFHRAVGSRGATLDKAASSGIADRIELWSYTLRGWNDHPIFGWGPGRFMPATGPYISDAFAIRFGHSWPDAHNIFLQWLVTLGVVGLAVGVTFVVVAGRRARGASAWMAAAIAVGWLVEPATSATLGLAALLLGASSIDRRRDVDAQASSSNVDRALAPFACAVGLLLAAWYVASDASVDTTLPDESGQGLLGWWYAYDPDVANSRSIHVTVREPDGKGSPAALFWSQRAAELEPEYSEWRAVLALLYLEARDMDAARAAGEQALELQPNDRLALSVLYVVGERTSDSSLIDMVAARLCDIDACPPGHQGDSKVGP
jgi:hypothetical protein